MGKNVPGQGNSKCRCLEMSGLLWQQQGGQRGWSEGRWVGASSNRGSLRTLPGISLIYNLALSLGWD